jgi:hypothetical protein
VSNTTIIGHKARTSKPSNKAAASERNPRNPAQTSNSTMKYRYNSNTTTRRSTPCTDTNAVRPPTHTCAVAPSGVLGKTAQRQGACRRLHACDPNCPIHVQSVHCVSRTHGRIIPTMRPLSDSRNVRKATLLRCVTSAIPSGAVLHTQQLNWELKQRMVKVLMSVVRCASRKPCLPCSQACPNPSAHALVGCVLGQQRECGQEHAALDIQHECPSSALAALHGNAADVDTCRTQSAVQTYAYVMRIVHLLLDIPVGMEVATKLRCQLQKFSARAAAMLCQAWPLASPNPLGVSLSSISIAQREASELQSATCGQNRRREATGIRVQNVSCASGMATGNASRFCWLPFGEFETPCAKFVRKLACNRIFIAT